MRYYNIELLQIVSEKLKSFLYGLQINFETSSAGEYCHFEILLDPLSDKFIKVSNFIEEM